MSIKIIFICGCLESGRDGVGDYSRKLAGELIRQGHNCYMISLMDKFLLIEKEEKQFDNEISIDTLRLPFVLGLKRNSITARKWAITKNADWVSFQYVPFSFNKRGLPISLAKQVAKITECMKLHLMIHEPFMGISKISPLKHKIIGYFQKAILKSIVKRLPQIYTTTTNKLYQLILHDIGIKADILCLFSNINKHPFDFNMYSTKLNEIEQFGNNKSKFRIICIFGTLYPNSNIETELQNQLIYTSKLDKELVFISFGRIGMSGLIEYELIKKKFDKKIKFFHIGDVSEREASHIAQLSDVAFSCTPSQHIGKSGVYAFLKLHNIPVILTTSQILPEYDRLMRKWYDDFEKRESLLWDVKYIANLYVKKLQQINIQYD